MRRPIRRKTLLVGIVICQTILLLVLLFTAKERLGL